MVVRQEHLYVFLAILRCVTNAAFPDGARVNDSILLASGRGTNLVGHFAEVILRRESPSLPIVCENNNQAGASEPSCWRMVVAQFGGVGRGGTSPSWAAA